MGADAFDEVVGGGGLEAGGNADGGNGGVFEAVGAAADLAVEMHVGIIVVIVMVAVAEFVADAFAAVFDGVDQVLLPEKRLRPGYDGFINGFQRGVQLSHGQGTTGRSEGVRDADTVGGRLDAVPFHQGEYRVVIHRRGNHFIAKIRNLCLKKNP